MKVTVIGTGGIGSAIGLPAARAGHRVVFGSRSPGSTTLADSSPASVTDITAALLDPDVVVLALPGRAVDDFLAEYGPALAGRLVVDAVNRMGSPTMNSAAEVQAIPGARYSRCFNSVGVENLLQPVFADGVADMFYTATESDRPVVESLIEAVGLRPIYLGPDAHAVADSVAALWFTLALGRQRGRHLAFRVLG
jgi:predicted dinucleotide-binding enzyme